MAKPQQNKNNPSKIQTNKNPGLPNIYQKAAICGGQVPRSMIIIQSFKIGKPAKHLRLF